MPLKNSSTVYLFKQLGAGIAVGMAVAAIARAADHPSSPALMPLPSQLQLGTAQGEIVVQETLSFSLSSKDEPRVEAAVARLGQAWTRHLGRSVRVALTNAMRAQLLITIAHPTDALPALGDNESYQLKVSQGQAVLTAETAVGALRGLATLQQALMLQGDRAVVPAMAIEDSPRFPWRGLMIDVSRHWQPMAVIKRNLDGMALVKLNVLHLHLTDDQGFRVESRTHPELTAKGSDGNYFTQEQLSEIVAYAAERGIRVVPEFDVPGHATSWVVSHPELASQPGPYRIERHWGVFNPVLDPTNEKTYALLSDFFGEMCALFPDAFFHIGGDENNGVQWNANSRIQAFIREHGLKDNAGLHNYFNQRVSEILRRQGKRLLGWDEILNPGLPPESVIDSWRGPDALAEAARRGYAGILANGYYIDLNFPARDHYLSDPLPADSTLNAEQRAHVLGGEAPMWAEWVNPDNIDTRIWPRTAAIAERFWSPAAVRDVADMYARLPAIDRALQDAGLRQGDWPVFPGVAAPTAKALALLANAVEPVKKYQRGGLQPDHVQSTPLNQLADWSRPDSTSARIFNETFQAWLENGSSNHDARLDVMEKQLRVWQGAGSRSADFFSGTDRVSVAQRQTAAALRAISDVGLECVKAIRDRRLVAQETAQPARAILDQAAIPTSTAVEFPFLPSLRGLLSAATARESSAPILPQDN